MTTITTYRPYAIVQSSAHMPMSVKAPYRHGVIVRTDGAHLPQTVRGGCGSKQIEYSGKLHAGGRHRDAWSDWLTNAEIEVRRLNDQHELALMTALGVAPWRIAQSMGELR
jgi:hypothetical protein